ncbi:MAG TPA: hypothetical protein VMR41_02605 [Patescibacteria group bacterium]|nr:hypothetical protein [Patescibacteria group bacterium]
MNTDSKARMLHAQTAKAREDGDYSSALASGDEALLAYDQENDDLGFAEVVADRSITLRNYGTLNDSKRLLILAKHEMLGSVAVARESGNKEALALPLYNLAQIQEDLGELKDAISTYKEAITNMENNPPVRHNRPSVLANMKVHMSTCEYKAGDKSALARAEAALRELESSDEAKYEKNIWISGGYMRFAQMLKTDNPEKAKEYLQKARGIIDANPNLKIRKQQWERLAKGFS